MAGIARADDTQFGASVRAFEGHEQLNYLDLMASRRIGDYRVQLGGDFSNTSTFAGNGFNIHHGGSDVELLATYFPRVFDGELSLGVSAPHTSARSNVAALTYRAVYNAGRWANAVFALESFGVASDDPVMIVGMEGSYTWQHLKFKAFMGTPSIGDNSISIRVGTHNRVGLFSAGVECSPGLIRGDAFSLAVTNQLGWTTGMAATPALGGFPGIQVAYTVKF